MERSQTIIMIRLENIERIGNIIKAHVQICQTHPEYFDIVVDLKEEQIVKCTREIDMFVAQALAKLVNLADEYGDKPLPKTEVSAWY